MESTNRYLNMHYVGTCKNFFAFENAIVDVIKYYYTKNEYIERNLSITRAISYYIRTYNVTEIIDHKF